MATIQPKPISRSTLLAWRKQIQEECRDWAATAREATQEERDAYNCGVSHGIAMLTESLRLHGHLTVTNQE